MFRLKWVADSSFRTFGVTFRILGIDFSIGVSGYINDWRLIDLRIPSECGVSLQILFLLMAISRLDNRYYQ